ncbi:MAG: arginine repressor [Thermoleophilia bacterium]|nr:arginine repressor [Thermoleophilia bacterium]
MTVTTGHGRGHSLRRERQGAILGLIRERAISTQSELATALHETGYDVVQTTVSRDVAELGLVKVRDGAGRLVYAPAGTADGDRHRALAAALRRWALTLEGSGSLVVVVTPRGYAAPLADAIDASGYSDIIGTVAGENTIIVVAREGVSGVELAGELRDLLELDG